MRIEINTTRLALCVCLLMTTATTRHASAMDFFGDTVANNAAAAEDEDDDESFFSGVSKPAIPQFTGSLKSKAPTSELHRQDYISVDVAAVCRAVLAESPSNYRKAFYDGCRKSVAAQPTRRTAR